MWVSARDSASPFSVHEPELGKFSSFGVQNNRKIQLSNIITLLWSQTPLCALFISMRSIGFQSFPSDKNSRQPGQPRHPMPQSVGSRPSVIKFLSPIGATPNIQAEMCGYHTLLISSQNLLPNDCYFLI
jgi:hypothetical protein